MKQNASGSMAKGIMIEFPKGRDRVKGKGEKPLSGAMQLIPSVRKSAVIRGLA